MTQMTELISKQEKLKRVNGVFLGVAIVMNFIVGTITDYIAISNLFPIAMVLLGVAAAVINISYGQVKLFVSLNGFIFLSLFTVQVLIGVILGKSSNSLYYAQCFLCVGLPSLFMATRRINCDVLRHTILVIAIASVSHFISILSKEYTVYTAGEQMGNAYSILAILFVSGWTLFDSRDSLNWKAVSIIVATLCFSILVKVMTRGAWLCVLVFISYLILKKTKNRKLFIVIIAVTPILLLMAWSVFINYVSHSEWFANIFRLKASDVLNGRSGLMEHALSYRGILNTVFGSGIGAYYGLYKTYPHNIFAQLYYDQGLIALLTVLAIFVKGCKGVVHNAMNGQKEDCLLILVICAGFVKLLVSSYFWIEQLFWIVMGLILARNKNSTIIGEGQQDNE